MRWGSLLAFVCALALVPACGDDDDGGPGGDAGASGSDGEGGEGNGATGPIAIDDLPPALADVFCDVIEDCFGSFYTIIPQPDCRQNIVNEFTNGQFSVLEAAVAAGRVEYDGDVAPDCIEAFRALGCDVLTERNLAVCEDALRGTVPLGEACSIDAECAGAAFCDVGTTCPGVCATPRALGETCESDDECASGLNCDGAACVERATAGAACEGPDGAQCQVGLVCSGATDTASGTCASTATLADGAEGEACNLSELDLCDPGLSCVFAGLVDLMPTFECRVKSEAGGPCQLGFPEPCPDGEYCDDPTPGTGDAGTCSPLPVAGEICLAAANRPLRCDPDLICVNDVCVARKANGGACTEDAECYGERCLDGECAGPELCTAE